VLEHRPHTRYGSQPMEYRREFEYEEELYTMEFDKGGYNFVLDEPLPVEVLEGRVRGKVKEPIEIALPRFDKEAGAYVMPDGMWVNIDRYGTTTPREMPFDWVPPPPPEGPELLEAADPTAEASVTDTEMPGVTPAPVIPLTSSVVPVTPSEASP
jgi:hypothetical protein